MDELERFIVYWLGPRREEYGEPEETLEGLLLPEPLRRLYAFAGRWPNLTTGNESYDKYGFVSIFSANDALLRLSSLEWTDDNKVVFITEAQGVWSFATLATGIDPPVWVSAENIAPDASEEWITIHDSLASFLTTFCLQELLYGSRLYVWHAELTKRLRSGQANVVPIWLNGTYTWPEHHYSFYLMEGDVLVGDFGNEIYGRCFFGANNESGIARL